MCEVRLRETLLDVKVTGISVIKDLDLVLAGVGGNLEIYSATDFRKLSQSRLFGGASIHGFAACPSHGSQIVIWGGKHWILIELIKNGDYKIRVPEQTAQDWLHDCQWIDQGSLRQLTAHNQVLVQPLEPVSDPPTKITCEEKCILYSGILVGQGLVLAGTVFSEIVIWNSTGAESEAKVLHRLQGHEGVIFSVSFNADSKILGSTSDDRSTRLWKVKFQVIFQINILE